MFLYSSLANWTEQDWLECANPAPMLYFLSEKASDRKMRLFACACLRRFWHELQDQCWERKAVEVAERFVDGLADKREMQKIHGKLWERSYGPKPSWGPFSGAAEELTARPRSQFGCRRASEVASMVACNAARTAGEPMIRETRRFTLEKDQTIMLRDIFGNPFRTPNLPPTLLTWNEATVRRLAEAIYDYRAVERLPILADALEEAGCVDVQVLNHCRQAGEHVRGCWVLDLLLCQA